MRDIMLDLETMGVAAGCPVLSIGAQAFDEHGVDEQGFYVIIGLESSKAAGLVVDPTTEKWWADQSEEARKVLTDTCAVELATAVGMFDNWLTQYSAPRIWGNGADFDLPILAAAIRASRQLVPWKPYNGRCYRTVKNQFPDIKMQRSGTHHHALDDARSQAEHMVRICQNRGWNLA